jgi:hypothetical protein
LHAQKYQKQTTGLPAEGSSLALFAPRAIFPTARRRKKRHFAGGAKKTPGPWDPGVNEFVVSWFI